MLWRHTWLLLLAVSSLLAAQTPEKDRHPKTIVFDPARLTQYSNVELIDLLSSESLKKNAQGGGMYSVAPPDRRARPVPGPGTSTNVKISLNSHALDFAETVEKELVARSAHADLMRIFEQTTDDVQQAWIMDTLSQMRLPLVDAFFRRYVRSSIDEGATYLSLKYFAGVCDPESLSILNKNYFQYHTSSMEWASIVRSFGECKYKPSVPNMVRTVNAMMLDLGYASHLSLAAIYPDAKIEFGDPSETQQAWKKYISHQH